MEAWEEVIALLDFLGIQYADITGPKPTTTANPGSPISDPDESPDNEDGQMESNVSALQYLIDVQSSPEWDTVNQETQNKLHILMCAAIALNIEDQEAL